MQKTRLAAAALTALLFIASVIACNKVSDYPIRSSIQKIDSAGSLIQALDSSQCHLFAQAFHRAGLDSLLTSNGAYTIFAPSDSAMTAAGLTAQVISSLAIDSLSKLIRYHIANGAFNDASLTSAVTNIQATTLLQEITTDSTMGDVVYQQYLYLKENGVVYINSLPVGNGTPAVATYNGYLFTIDQFMTAPHQTLWDIISTDPRLSLYSAALRIDDSLFLVHERTEYWVTDITDTLFFSTLYYTNVRNSSIVNTNQPTVFAPTDSAFHAAGFQTVDDIRNYALSTPLTTTGNYTNYGMSYNDIPMDSILYGHVIYNKYNTQPDGLLVLYNDLLFSPLINHGLPNANTFQVLSSMYQAYFEPNVLYFTVNNGIPYIQWNASQAPVPVLPDTDPANPRHFLTKNGAIYLVDQLFTSPN